MGCGETTVKYLLFFFNLIFALAGLILLGLGTAGVLKVEKIVNGVFKGDDYMLPILAIALGSIVFFIAFFGCCGAIMESDCMLITFSVFMVLLIIVKITLVVLLFTLKELNEGLVQMLMQKPRMHPPSEDHRAIVEQTVRSWKLTLCGIIMGVAALELIAMVFGCCLASHVRTKMRRGVGGAGGNMIIMR